MAAGLSGRQAGAMISRTGLAQTASVSSWKVLWLPESRSVSTVAAECEYLTRIWPQIKAEVFRELQGCDHQSGLGQLRQVGGGVR